MELFLWKGYKVYFYDEDNGTNYVEEFLKSLSYKDADEAAKIIGRTTKICGNIGINLKIYCSPEGMDRMKSSKINPRGVMRNARKTLDS